MERTSIESIELNFKKADFAHNKKDEVKVWSCLMMVGALLPR